MNMNLEYKTELKELRKSRKTAVSEYGKSLDQITKELNRLESLRTKTRKAAHRNFDRIDRRIAILEGRMS